MFTNLDIKFQVLALVSLILLHVMFRTNRKIFLIRERVFYIALNIASIEAILDILHVITINLKDVLPEIVTSLVCRFYLLSVVVFTSCILLYTLSEIHAGNLFADKRRYIYIVIDAIAFPVLLNTKINYTLDNNNVGMHGNIILATLIMCVAYLFIAVINVYLNKTSINRLRRNTVYLSCLALAVAGIFQINTLSFLVFSPAIALVMTYMYFCLEPPGEYYDGILGVFNYEAYKLYLNNAVSNKKKVSLLYIKINDYSKMQEVFGNTLRTIFLKKICSFLSSYKNAKTFYMGNGEMIMAFEKSEYFIANVQEIRKRISEVWNVSEKESGVVEIEVSSVIIAYPYERMEGMFTIENIEETLEYFSSKFRSANNDEFLCIDRRQIREKQRYDHVAESMDKAISEGRIEVYYQGIYSVDEDKTVALEALMRITDDRGVVLQNDMIISYAERTGQIRELGNIVLKKICSFVRTHSLYELEIYTIHINLSIMQCQDSRMAGDFIDIMDSYQLPASMFLFEISGALTSYNSINFKKNMDRLSEIGARFIVDNYGQASSNIERMIMMNLNAVKFGPKMVKDYFSNTKIRNSIRTDCRLMKQMNITLMAVGVENQQQYNEFKKLGVSYMQGEVFYKPMDGNHMLRAITRERDRGMEREALYERVL